MTYKEQIEKGLNQLPAATEMWLNPRDQEIIESDHPKYLDSLGLKIRIHHVMQQGTFLLSEKDLLKQIESHSNIKPIDSFTIEWRTQKGLDIL